MLYSIAYQIDLSSIQKLIVGSFMSKHLIIMCSRLNENAAGPAAISIDVLIANATELTK